MDLVALPHCYKLQTITCVDKYDIIILILNNLIVYELLIEN